MDKQYNGKIENERNYDCLESDSNKGACSVFGLCLYELKQMREAALRNLRDTLIALEEGKRKALESQTFY